MSEPRYKNALITGASSGLGRGLAIWFAKNGTQVYATGRRIDALVGLQKEIGANIQPIEMDVAQPRRTLQQIQDIDRKSGGLDLVIANAGVGGAVPIKRLTWDFIEKMVQINVMGACATLYAALPGMIDRGRGHLVGISSIAAWRGLPKAAGYSASKAFLATFLEGLRVELRDSGVKVTSIHPGFVKSEMTAKNKFKMPFLLETDDAVQRMVHSILRGDSSYAFPWQMAAAMKVVKVIPNALFDVVAGRAESGSFRERG
jgi:short-subunit dehydrogenase